MKRFHLVVGLIVTGHLALAVGPILAVVVTQVETRIHDPNDPNGIGRGAVPASPFSTVPNLSASDYADAASGNSVTIAHVAGNAHKLTGPVTKLLDGLWQAIDDSPVDSFFGNADDMAFQIDLQAAINVAQVNVYTRHKGIRSPAGYDLYGSADPNAPSNDGSTAGWTLIESVDTTDPNFTGDPNVTGPSFDGIVGISTLDNTGSLGNFRHLLFDTTLGFTFYGEVDVVEPSVGCDFDGGGCGLSDINLMMAQGDLTMGVPVASGNQFDLNADNTINEADITVWLSLTGTTNGYTSPMLRGDTDDLGQMDPNDRTVDITDFQNFLKGFTGAGSTWEVGNFNGDTVVDITDFSNHFLPSFVATAGGSYGPGQSIPEPSTVLLLGLGGMLLVYLWCRGS